MFKLHKVKQKPNGKIEVNYSIVNSEAGTTDKYIVEPDRAAHPDFFNALKRLDVFLCDSNSLRFHRLLEGMKLEPKKKKLIAEAGDVFAILDKEILATVQASGVVVFGSEDHRGCVVTGKHRTHNTAVALNSPKISENGDTFGFETDLFAAVDALIEETEAYIIRGKSSQMNLFEQKEEGEPVLKTA